MTERHAHTSDLPGWPCPPRVRDIPQHENSWGWVLIAPNFLGCIAQDELGYLWADGSAVPTSRIPDESNVNPGAVVCWTEYGLGVWVHERSLHNLRSISRLDVENDRWVPIVVALGELPGFVKRS